MSKNLLLILFAGLVLLLSNIWGYRIYMLDEVKNAGCAKEMFERGDWIVPTFNQELRTDKPPLHYFFMMLAYQLFGVSSFSARLFSGLFGLGTLLLTWIIAKKEIDTRVANLSSLVLLASIGFHFQFHLAVPDPYLVFFVALSIFAFFQYLKDPQISWLLGFYASMAMATLTKGPIGVLLPGAIALTFLIHQRSLNWRTIWGLRPVVGIFVVAVITLPWYWAVHQATDGAWTQGFFIGHNVDRFQTPKEGHGGSFLLTIGFYLATALPFGVYLPQALWKAYKHRATPLLALSVITILVFLVFFSVAQTKLPSYTSPTFPFTAIVLGYFITTFDTEKLHSWHMILSEVVFAIICFSLPVVFFLLGRMTSDFRHVAALAPWLVVLPVGALLSGYFLWKKDLMRSTYSKVSSFALSSLIIFYGVLPGVDQSNPILEVAKDLEKADGIIGFKRVNPAFIFHLERQIPIYFDIDSIRTHLKGETILITRDKYLDELSTMDLEIVAAPSDILDGTTTIVARKR